jgi:hypothetical protein
MALWVAVHGIQDGEDIDFNTLNRPVFELTERTNYLYEQLQALTGVGAFESVRITNASVETSGLDAPAVGDFVYLNEVTGLYTKAKADVAIDDLFAAANSSLAVGLVVSLANALATIVLYGKEDLTTNGASWDLSTLVQSDETFRNGPYYLSSSEAGKITANPSGVSIYLGYFLEDPTNPGYGGYALLSPQYKDLKSAHEPRAYPLHAQPAGTQAVSGPTPVDTHSVLGFEPSDISGQGAPDNDRQPRLVPLGTWTGTSDAEYTIWLSDSSDDDESLGGTTPPTDWSDLHLHWQSSDAAEGKAAVRLWSFDTPVAVGTKGLYISIENPDGTAWSNPYTVVTDNEDKRTWLITAPTQTRGWLARYYRQYFTDYPATDNGFSFILKGGPAASGDDRIWDQLTLKCGKLYRIVYTGLPLDAEVITVGTTTFEFDDDSSITSDYAVEIATTADETYQNLLDAILAADLTGYDVAINTDDGHVVVSVPAAATVSGVITLAAISYVAAGAGDIAGGTASLLVYDQYHKALIASDSYWSNISYWDTVDLKNDLSLLVIPYDIDGTPASAGTVAVDDYWDVQFNDEAPTAKFAYAMGMHTGLLQHYPPVPLSAAVLILNGVELDGYAQFPIDPTYRLAPVSLHWYSDTLASVPWPRDWVDVDNPGSAAYAQNMLLHFVKMSAGDAGIVTSLRPASGSPIRVLQCGTNDPGTVGDLALDVDLELEEEQADLTGYQVFKAASGQKLRKGPIVEKITSSDGSVGVASSVGAPAGQGIVDLTIGGASYGGEFEEVALENAKQELIGMFPYISLTGWETGSSNNIPSGFVAKFRVPHDIGDPDDPPEFKVLVYMTVFGEEDIPWVGGGAAQYAGVDFSYSILPDYNYINNVWPDSVPGEPGAWNSLNQTLPGGLLTVTNPLHAEVPLGRYDNPQDGSNPIYAAYDPMLIHNNSSEGSDEARKVVQALGNPFPIAGELNGWDTGTWGEPSVKPGSLVAIRVERSDLLSGSTEYTGSLGFINIRWKLVGIPS